MKFSRGLLLVLAVTAIPLSATSPVRLPACPAAALRAPVALLVDLSSGRTLCEHNSTAGFPPASMTKAMTALVVFDLIKAGKLREGTVVSVRPETATRWAGKGTTLSLKPGEKVTIGELLMGTTTVSANDAAVALAENALGSTDAFVAAMNARATALGMSRSHFGSPNGFPDRGITVVSAVDLVKLAETLISEHPELYRRYIGKKIMVWRGATLSSHDPFAGVLPGADGIKTGHTFEAGFNFLGAVDRDGRRLVLVVGGARTETDRANAARELAEWGYSNWTSRPFLSQGMIVGSARVQNGDARAVALAVPLAYSLAVLKEQDGRVRGRIHYEGPLEAPVALGQQVAHLELNTPGLPPYEIPLVSAEAVAKAGPIDRIVNALLGLFS